MDRLALSRQTLRCQRNYSISTSTLLGLWIFHAPDGPDPNRPHPMTLLRSLYLWNGLTNSRAVFFVRCHHSINFVFDLHRYPPVPATARVTCRARGCLRHTSLDNSMTAGPIALKSFTQVRGEVHLHVRTCTPLYHILKTAGLIAFKYSVWLGTH